MSLSNDSLGRARKLDPVTGKFVRYLSDEERIANSRASAKRYRRKLTSERHLQANHGMTLEVAKQLVESKPKHCEICARERKLHYDHDHATGEHRGWLCCSCNTRLCMVDNPELHEAALRYLGKEPYDTSRAGTQREVAA